MDPAATANHNDPDEEQVVEMSDEEYEFRKLEQRLKSGEGVTK